MHNRIDDILPNQFGGKFITFLLIFVCFNEKPDLKIIFRVFLCLVISEKKWFKLKLSLDFLYIA